MYQFVPVFVFVRCLPLFKTTKELLWKSNLQIDSWVRNQRREDREIKKKKNGSREEVEDFHQVHRKISGGVGVI